MDPFTVVLLIVGVLLAIIGGVMLLVAAFQENVWWGLASLFVPLASLVFVICHWSRARLGFGVSMLGSVILVGAVLQGTPQIREMFARRVMLPVVFEAKPAAAQDLSAQIQERRESLEQLERQFAEDGVALAIRFQVLTARRKALAGEDAGAVAEFNIEAATYQSQNAARKVARAQIDSTRRELESLLDERSRVAAAGAVAGAKRVVMYTTATCPACVAAKTYMARKGIAFEEHDVNRSPEARAEFQRLGGRGVPLIMVGSERMEGFNAARLDQIL